MKYREIVERGVRFRIFEDNQVWARTEYAEWHKLTVSKAYGFPSCWIVMNGSCMTFDVFRLKALAYTPKSQQTELAFPKDGNRFNLSVDNLSWKTRKEHMDDLRKRHLEKARQRKEERKRAEAEKDPARENGR